MQKSVGAKQTILSHMAAIADKLKKCTYVLGNNTNTFFMGSTDFVCPSLSVLRSANTNIKNTNLTVQSQDNIVHKRRRTIHHNKKTYFYFPRQKDYGTRRRSHSFPCSNCARPFHSLTHAKKTTFSAHAPTHTNPCDVNPFFIPHTRSHLCP